MRLDASELVSPHTLLPPLGFTERNVGKTTLGLHRAAGGKTDVNRGLRGDRHWVGFITMLSGSKLPEAEGE